MQHLYAYFNINPKISLNIFLNIEQIVLFSLQDAHSIELIINK